MSELDKFIRQRNINNVVNGSIAAIKPENPLLFDVKMPDGSTMTLPTAEKISLAVDDPVQVVLPSGDRKQAYIAGKAATVLGADPINKVLGMGQG